MNIARRVSVPAAHTISDSDYHTISAAPRKDGRRLLRKESLNAEAAENAERNEEPFSKTQRSFSLRSLRPLR
jgi:hypothetical protein